MDLSTHHEPITSLFPRVSAADDGARYRLTVEQLAFFEENGYLAGVRVLRNEQIDALRSELRDVADPTHPGHDLFYEFHSNESADPSRVLFHALGAWRIAPGFHDLLWHPAVTMPCAQLLGGAVRFWHDQIFSKPPRHGGVVAWHQDYSYWTRTEPIAHLTCWIGLDDATEEFTMLYTDARGVHRVYKMTFADNVWTIWRDATGFNQRFTGTVSAESTPWMGVGRCRRTA